MKKQNDNTQIDLSSHIALQTMVDKWRDILGVDQVYVIQLIETTEDTGHPAWVDGLAYDNPHPIVNVFINANWLQENKYNKREVLSTIVHELLHIVVFEAFLMIDPSYKYEGLKARANEILTMKLTRGIMDAYFKEIEK